MHKRMRLQDHLEEIVSPTSDSTVVMSSPLNGAKGFKFLEQGTFVQLRTWWSSFQTWSQHKNDLLIEMCWVSHKLWGQITLLLESLVSSGSPGHRSRVTLQHIEAYRVTGAQVPGHPLKCTCCVYTGQTGACHWSDRWPPIYTFLVIFPSSFLECVNVSLI
jgi:hypothetical protein